MTSSDMLKGLIIELRDAGMTFQQIADYIEREYGIKRSRQAIHKTYKNAVESNIDPLSDNEIATINDVVNLYSLGYTYNDIVGILENRGKDISYYKVTRILDDNDDYLLNVKYTLRNRIFELLSSGCSKEVMIENTSYNGIKMTDSKFCSIIDEISREKIVRYAMKIIKDAYSLTGSQDVAKSLCSGCYSLSLSKIK